MTTLHCPSIATLPQTAERIVALGQGYDIWIFEGEMGAGKTTTIRAICEVLGVRGQVQSPTFALVNEYLTTQVQTIYHFDCYRLKSEMEALDFGIEEYFDSGNLCLIEWPSKIANLLPPKYLKISIEAMGVEERRIVLEGFL